MKVINGLIRLCSTLCTSIKGNFIPTRQTFGKEKFDFIVKKVTLDWCNMKYQENPIQIFKDLDNPFFPEPLYRKKSFVCIKLKIMKTCRCRNPIGIMLESGKEISFSFLLEVHQILMMIHLEIEMRYRKFEPIIGFRKKSNEILLESRYRKEISSIIGPLSTNALKLT